MTCRLLQRLGLFLSRCDLYRPVLHAAGYAGPPTDELLDSLKVTRYQSSKAALSFSEYSSSCSNRLGVADVQQLLQSSSNGGSSSKNGRLRLAFAPN